LIEESIYEKFRNEFVAKTKQLKVGDPLDESSKQGSLVSKMHFDKIVKSIETARSEGGTVLCGGNAVKPEGRCENGYFFEPTIIEGVGCECSTNMEEIFGPVVTLQPFKDESEALQKANACNYGLSATIWTQDITRS
jgi:aminomuconate-semialdehyde/2-hydroxymuconate-6-semialdehyde dehydrogenase